MRSLAVRTVAAVAGLALVVPSQGAASGTSSLPSVVEGPKPGPAALYAAAATTPILQNSGRWDAAPILISGVAAYRDGEFVYQDYIHDDYGANTTNALFPTPDHRIPASSVAFGGQTGDVVYPTDNARYGFNAADLLELRIDAGASEIAYRFTLNTMKAAGAAAIAVGIDTGDDKAKADWGHGLGSLGPTGVDHVLYTDGISAEVGGSPVAVSTDLARNQIEVVVPRTILDPPADAVWEHFAVTGIADGAGGFAALGQSPTATKPGGAQNTTAPPVFNVAFRFESEGDEPMTGSPLTTATQAGTRTVGAGNWREHGQALALAARDISRFSARVEFETLAAGTEWDNAPASGYMNRLYVSALDLGEGVANARPWLLGKIQPYSVYIPTTYAPGTPAGLVLVLHSLSATYNQFAVFSPNTYRDLAEDRGAIALTTMGRGPDSWYQREGELDVFEAWADLARNYDLDPDRVAINGYSMGGFGTYKLGAMYPDLFGKAFPVVGPPAEGIWVGSGSGTTLTHTILENFRNVPLMIWNGVADELVPISGVTVQANRLDQLGYRHLFDVFTADHFALAIRDEWDRAGSWMGDASIDRDPVHITYKVMPADDYAPYGLVHDKAYWAWDIQKAPSGATGTLDVRSLAFGAGDPASAPAAGAGVDPLPYVERGRTWGAAPATAAQNALAITLTNIAGATFGTTRAGLDVTQPIALQVSSDVASTIRLRGAFGGGVTVTGGATSYSLSGDVLSIAVPSGTRTLTVAP